METRQTLEEQIYTPAKVLKGKFYAAKTIDEWNQCKEELKPLLAKIDEPLMTTDFAAKYKKNLVDSIAKMWQYKKTYFEKQQQGKKQFTQKVVYLLQDNLANALTKYIELQTKLLELDYEARCGARLEEEYN